MSAATFRAAAWASSPQDICNAAGHPLYKYGRLDWTRPAEWRSGFPVPLGKLAGAALYVISRNHGNAQLKHMIEYVGLASNVRTRFYNHPTAVDLRNKPGQTYLSFAPVDFVRGRDRIASQKRAMEEIEHLLIWALNPPYNDRKNYTLPGMGANGANAWHVENTGFRFAGQMPKEIVFPWMLVKPGTDRSVKR